VYTSGLPPGTAQPSTWVPFESFGESGLVQGSTVHVGALFMCVAAKRYRRSSAKRFCHHSAS